MIYKLNYFKEVIILNRMGVVIRAECYSTILIFTAPYLGFLS